MRQNWKNTLGRLVGLAALCVLTLLMSQNAFADNPRLDFALHNKTGVAIVNIYVGPAPQEEWGDDTLGDVEVLGNGESAEISFSPKADEDLWDVKVVDKDGNSYEWIGLDLSDITDISLYYKNQECTAVLENRDQ